MKPRIEISNPILERIGRIADGLGITAYAVGGFVRDTFLGREKKDIDVLVVGRGIEFANKVAQEFNAGSLSIYENFGTAMLRLDDYVLEFVGARKESYHKYSRKPAVEEGTLVDDLSRRDFTVNALALSINSETFGELTDLFAGIQDLKRSLLKTPLDPEQTFNDDPLRILRAFRFAAQLGFDVEEKTFNAASLMAPRLAIISAERIANEFIQMMESPEPARGLDLMLKAKVYPHFFPELQGMSGVEQREEYHHKDVFYHSLLVLENIVPHTGDVWLRFAALLHDVGKPKTKSFAEGLGWTFHGHEEVGARMVKQIFRRMKFPLEKGKYVEKLVRLHMRPMALVDDEVSDSAIRRLLFEAGDDIDDLMKLCRADITSRNPRKVHMVLGNYERLALKMLEVEEKDALRSWQPPVKGDEIMELFGLRPGKEVGRLKQLLTDAILDGQIPNEREAALEFLKLEAGKILRTK